MCHRRNAVLAALLSVIGLAPAAAQGIVIPNTFVNGTTADADQVNANFTALANNALNRTGGTMSGTLTTQVVLPDGDNTRNLGSAAASYASTWFDGTATIATATITTLNVAGTGPHVIGGSSSTQDQLRITGTFTGVANVVGVNLLSTLTAPANGAGYGVQLAPTLNEAASGTHGLFATLNLEAPTIGAGAAALTRAATLNIASAPSAGTTNHALYVVSGNVFVGGRIESATLQPGFLAYNSADDVTVSSGTTVDFDTESYDDASNFSGDTFTAPVTGRYLLSAIVHTDDGSVGTQLRFIRIVTNQRTYTVGAAVAALATDPLTLSGSVIAGMAAGDTATVQILLSSGTVTISGTASPNATVFSGRLLP